MDKEKLVKCFDCGKPFPSAIMKIKEFGGNKFIKICAECQLKREGILPKGLNVDSSESKSQATNNSQKVYKPGQVVFTDEPKGILHDDLVDANRYAIKFNEPEHYHKHKIDTIQFLQEGFPPEIFKGFAIGSAIKYLQRFENKNGLEDLIKAKDYVERLIDWYYKTKDPSK